MSRRKRRRTGLRSVLILAAGALTGALLWRWVFSVASQTEQAPGLVAQPTPAAVQPAAGNTEHLSGADRKGLEDILREKNPTAHR